MFTVHFTIKCATLLLKCATLHQMCCFDLLPKRRIDGRVKIVYNSPQRTSRSSEKFLGLDSRIYGVSRFERYPTSRVRRTYVSIRSSYSSTRSSYSSYAELLRFLCVHLKIRSTYLAGPIRRTYVTHTSYIRKQCDRYAVDT